MKVVVGGPPHSGKSTFTAGIIERIRERCRGAPFHIQFTWDTLDVTDNTLAYLLDETGETPMKNEDIEWTDQTAKTRRASFDGRDEQLVIADAPGRLTDELNIVLEPADVMIVLASDEKSDQINAWCERAEESNIDVYGIITSVLDPDVEPGWENHPGDSWKGTIRSTEREAFKRQKVGAYDDVSGRMIRQLATDLLEQAAKERYQ